MKLYEYFKFGRFKGRRFDKIWADYPDYIYWCMHNIDNFTLPPCIIKYIKSKGYNVDTYVWRRMYYKN